MEEWKGPSDIIAGYLMEMRRIEPLTTTPPASWLAPGCDMAGHVLGVFAHAQKQP